MTVRQTLVLMSLALGALPLAGYGQDADVLAKLKQRHTELMRTREPLTVEEAAALQKQLKEWNLAGMNLTGEPRAEWLHLEVLAALGVGDARLAGDYAAAAMGDDSTSPATLHVTWWSAAAQGNAELAKKVLDTLEKTGIARGRAVERRRQRIELVGHPAPEKTVTAENGTRFDLRDRKGVILVLDLWRTDTAPDKKEADALKALAQQYANRPQVAFLSINADGPDELAAAKKFVADHGYTWPQVYEKAAGKAPLADEAFHLGSEPLQVLIGPYGYIRWVGDASDPAFVYALRATAKQAVGDAAAVMPRTVSGEQARTPDDKHAAEAAREKAAAAAAKEKEQRENAVPSSQLPSNPEARSMLDQARVYLKTGRKRDARKLLQEIVEKYPGTREAAEAKERLEYL